MTRADCQEFGTWLDTRRHRRTGAPLAISTKRSDLQAVLGFFRDGSAWEWTDMPARPLLIAGDLPKVPRAVPRFIPAPELAALMDAIRALPCPYQRAALLIARWCGARRGEIRMLELDCLDAYPDGTPRLRLPAGKTYTERMVPINDEAAVAVREVQALRHEQGDRPLPGSHVQRAARRLFRTTSSTTPCGQPAKPRVCSTVPPSPQSPLTASGTPSVPSWQHAALDCTRS